MTDDHSFAASDGGVPMIFRTAKASQHGDTFQPARNHKTTCAGCDCEPGTTCDSRKSCGECYQSKTACDAFKSEPVDREPCCPFCTHG